MRHLWRRGDQRRSGAERQPDLLNRRVECERETLVNAVIGAHVEDASLGAYQVAGAPMLDHDALGPAGGAGSVDHVTKVPRPYANRVIRQACGALGIDRLAVGVNADDCAAKPRVALRQLGVRHEGPGSAVLEDVRDTVGRVLRVERHIGRAGLENAEQSRIGVRRPREEHGDQRSALHSARTEVAREPVGARFQVGIRSLLPVEYDRDGVRPGVGLHLEDLVEDMEVVQP